jgi:hypothetical protein
MEEENISCTLKNQHEFLKHAVQVERQEYARVLLPDRPSKSHCDKSVDVARALKARPLLVEAD